VIRGAGQTWHVSLCGADKQRSRSEKGIRRCHAIPLSKLIAHFRHADRAAKRHANRGKASSDADRGGPCVWKTAKRGRRPAFLRSANGSQPTERADEIAQAIREGLRQLRGALTSPIFEPALASRRFTIAAGAYFWALLVPQLVQRLGQEAPDVALRFVPIAETLISSMYRGAVDLALAGYIAMPRRFVEAPMHTEEMVWVAAIDHPLAHAPIDPVGIARASRVMLSVRRKLDPSQSAAVDAVQDQNFLSEPPEIEVSAEYE